MAVKRVNVLVYSGVGSTIESVRHTLYSLRRLLSPNYAVIPVAENAILKEPWPASCALLVFPGGADLGYCRVLNGDGNVNITQYVRRGGAYLGLCAGGYYGSARCEFEAGNREMEVVGNRELAFFPGTCRGCAFKGFIYQSEHGARAAEVKVDGESFGVGVTPTSFRSYYNGGGVFVDAAKMADQGVVVLANYTEPMDVDGGIGGLGAAAVVFRKVGDGNVILTGTHPEFAAVNLDAASGGSEYAAVVQAIKDDDEARTTFLKACLRKLGLTVSDETAAMPSLSRLHLTSMNHSEAGDLMKALKDVITSEDGEDYIRGENDTFHIERSDTKWSLQSMLDVLPSIGGKKDEEASTCDDAMNGIVDYNTVTKKMIPHDSAWPGSKETPYFNHHAFYAHLRTYQNERSSEAEVFGKVLLYGEVVTSTNTLLEKNPKLLNHLPTGFTATATVQVAGRGRGSNVWVSPPGSLMWSTCLMHPATLSTTAPVVFVQYLMAIAVVEGIKTYDHGYSDMPVKLKWPNDIYGRDPSKPDSKEYVKIGGILVNSSYSSGAYNLVVGVGLNTSNAAPTTSLNSLLEHLQTLGIRSKSPSAPSRRPLASFTLEKLLARILTTFETIYKSFIRTGFDAALEAKYYSHWLHNEQIVTLEAEGGVRARIKGITRDWGMLKVEELGWEDRGTGRSWELMSDSNSFDFFRGLLKRKV